MCSCSRSYGRSVAAQTGTTQAHAAHPMAMHAIFAWNHLRMQPLHGLQRVPRYRALSTPRPRRPPVPEMPDWALEPPGVTEPACCWLPPWVGAANWKALGARESVPGAEAPELTGVPSGPEVWMLPSGPTIMAWPPVAGVGGMRISVSMR